MILQALKEYYERKAADPDSNLAPKGWQTQALPFLIVLDNQGHFIQFQDTREIVDKKSRARSFLVPLAYKRQGPGAWKVASLLWDNAAYILGYDPGDLETASKKHKSFKERFSRTFSEPDADEGLRAMFQFLDNIPMESISKDPLWKEIEESNPFMSFRLSSEPGLICTRPAVQRLINDIPTHANVSETVCIVSGEMDRPTRLHHSIKGVWGAHTAGADIVSYNLDAFCSFEKEQGSNAPIGEKTAFAFATALNHLLRRNSGQRIQVGDATTVFWSEKASALEGLLADIFGETKDDPDRNTRAIRSLFEAPKTGQFVLDDDKTRFFVLGLAPNSKRLAVRFWHVSTVAELAQRIRRHFEDLKIALSPKDIEYPSLFRLLVSTAVQGKADNIPPNLGGDTMRSILEGLPYPHTLLSGTIRRIRAEHEITPVRAAIIKACLNRQNRFSSNPLEKEVTVSLDETNDNAGYRLGRLFAVLEKAQEEAQGSLNTTIRDRFYGAASSTPVTVFPRLLKLNKHHLSKLENRGRAVNLEKIIGQVVDAIDGKNGFPAHLELDDQGRFAIGYYHQRQAFFAKREQTEETTKGESL